MQGEAVKKRRVKRIIQAYPLALIGVAILVNLFVFGISPMDLRPPEASVFAALVIAAVLLLLNHSWLMTRTELTRLDHDIRATPEEWASSGIARNAVSDTGWQELERHHNAHRNTTENLVYFALLAPLMCVVGATAMSAEVWFLGFAIGRLGHSFAYLAGKDGLRGLSMSLALLSLYGLGSYLLASLLWFAGS